MDYETIIMTLVTNGGNARSLAMMSIEKARAGEYEEAHQLLKQADQAIGEAHECQTELIQGEVRGDSLSVSLLLVHAQDHIMTAMLAIDMAKELVKVYVKFNQ